MSIEMQLERIANAVETLVGLSKTAAPSIDVPKETAPKRQNKKTETDPIPVEPQTGRPLEKDAEPAITEGELLAVLQKHVDRFTADKTKKLMIKHGADKDIPKIKSIPPANYKALKAEALGDLAKPVTLAPEKELFS